MNLNEIVRYIHEHALGTFEPWEKEILATITVIESTEDGFRIVSTWHPKYWVGMKEFMGKIFVQTHERDQLMGVTTRFECLASDQMMARTIYNQMLEFITTP